MTPLESVLTICFIALLLAHFTRAAAYRELKKAMLGWKRASQGWKDLVDVHRDNAEYWYLNYKRVVRK